MKTITIELTDIEYKCLEYISMSPEEWAINAVTNRASIAHKEIVQEAVEKYVEFGIQIPPSSDMIITDAFDGGWVKTMLDASKEAEQGVL